MNSRTDTQHRSLVPWPTVIGPRPGLKEINVICWALFCLCVVTPAVVILSMQMKSSNLYFEKAPVDFVYFYGIGQIAKTHPAIDVYDYQLQTEIFNKIQPLRNGKYGPSPYPPFVSQFFRLFAGLSFKSAFLLWFAISLTLYVAGIVLALRAFLPEEPLVRSLILCFALSSSPFLLNTLGNGQLSSIGLFFMVLALLFQKRSMPILSGTALSVLIYKPTLLLIVVPMLVITRRFKTLLGVTSGAGVLMLIATLIGGIRIWPAYLRFLSSFGQTSGVYGQSSLRLWKYVDLNSLSYAVPDGRSRIALTFLVCFVVAVALWAGIALWKSEGKNDPRQSLAWAVAITWTSLLNVYSPIYDSILIVIAIILALSALGELKWVRASEWVVLLAVLMFAVAWVTEAIAKNYGVQLLTLALLAFAITLTYLLQRANGTLFVSPAEVVIL